MTAFLLAISLILNGVAIFLIMILYTRQNRLVEVEKNQEQMMKEMEEALSSYLIEMKEENEAFIKRFQQLHPVPSTEGNSANVPANPTSTIKTAPVMEDAAEANDWSDKAGKAFKKQAVKAYQNNAAKKTDPHPSTEENLKEDAGNSEAEKQSGQKETETSDEEIYRDLFVNQVKILQKRGYSVDDIAKKLNKGKTEIELLLKFG